MANRHLSYEEFKNIFGDLGVTEWTKYNWLDNNFNLPSNLCRVEYIESSGTQYIETGVQLDDKDFRIETEIEMAEAIYQEQPICSIWLAEYRYWNWFIVPYSSNKWKTDVYLAEHVYSPNDIAVGQKVNCTLTKSGDTWTMTNGNNTISKDYVPDRVNPTTIKIFTRGDTPDQDSANTHIKLYYLKILVDGNLVRSFVPVFDTTTGKYGLYDLVGKQFYGNAGTGDFTGANAYKSFRLADISAATWQNYSSEDRHIWRAPSSVLTDISEINDNVPAPGFITGYNMLGYNPISGNDDGCCAISTTTDRIVIVDYDYSSADDFYQHLVDYNVYCYYKIS